MSGVVMLRSKIRNPWVLVRTTGAVVVAPGSLLRVAEVARSSAAERTELAQQVHPDKAGVRMKSSVVRCGSKLIVQAGAGLVCSACSVSEPCSTRCLELWRGQRKTLERLYQDTFGVGNASMDGKGERGGGARVWGTHSTKCKYGNRVGQVWSNNGIEGVVCVCVRACCVCVLLGGLSWLAGWTNGGVGGQRRPGGGRTREEIRSTTTGSG